MPSIAPAPTPTSPQLNGRKRRRDDMNEEASAAMEKQIEMKLAASPLQFHHQTTTLCQADMLCEIGSERKHMLPRPRRDRDTKHKKQRTSSAWEPWTTTTLPDMENHDDVDYTPKEEQCLRTVYPAKVDLSPCHICHRKPSERKELDGYAHCEGCGRRTCYVCIRQCDGLEVARYFGDQDVFGGRRGESDGRLGWRADEMCVERGARESAWDDGVDGNTFGRDPWSKEDRRGHRGKVCSRCCVERGEEGEVCCLGCLRAEECLMRVDIGHAAGQRSNLGRRTLLMTDEF